MTTPTNVTHLPGEPATIEIKSAAKTTRDELALIEAHLPAKEIASKQIGRHGVPWIAFLVVVGVGASYFLPATVLPAVVGLVSTAVMALIAMVTGITGVKEKEERPEFTVIRELIARLDRKDPPVQVRVEGDRVIVTHGDDLITTAKVLKDENGVSLKVEQPPPLKP